MLYLFVLLTYLLFFFFNDTATTEIYTLSLHDALPISIGRPTSCASSWREAIESVLLPKARSCRARRAIAQSPRTSEERSEEHTSELQSPDHLVCRLLLEKKKKYLLIMLPKSNLIAPYY